MTNHPNRGAITVDLNGNWRLYTTHIPAGFRCLGTVTRGAETGALVRNISTSIYAMLNAGVISSLPQPKVAAAIKATRVPVGPPRVLDGGRPVRIYLDAESILIASVLGDGNISAGIRAALRRAAP